MNIMWKVLNEIERAPAYKGRNKGARQWMTECVDCKSQVKFESDDLKNLQHKNCFTCLMEKRSLAGAKQACINDCFNIYKKSAQKRKYDFDLDKEYFAKMIQQNCHYCGVPPCRDHEKSRKKYKLNFMVNGIDRLDNKIGYTNENVVTCCTICNRAKSDMTQEEWSTWTERFSSYNVQRLS